MIATPADVILDLPEDVPAVIADAGLLERALANIVVNAAAYSPADEPPRIVAGAVDGGVDVRIVDRGPGVPAAERDRMFVPFQHLNTNLRARGYEVDLAPTGETALDLAARKHPDLVILDLGLPGIDGVEVIRDPIPPGRVTS